MKPPEERVRESTAFTLVELLVVVSIIALLMAILLPALTKARAVAQSVRCATQLHGIMQGFHIYATEHHNLLPHQYVLLSGGAAKTDWSGAIHNVLKQTRVFACPIDKVERRPDLKAYAIRSYAINSAKWTFLSNGYKSPWPWPLDPDTISPSKLSNVPPQVLLVGENHGHDGDPAGDQSAPGWNADGGAIVGIAEFEGLDGWAWDLHPSGSGATGGNGVNYGFADGRVEFLSKRYVDQWQADTDYAGDSRDPWKWK